MSDKPASESFDGWNVIEEKFSHSWAYHEILRDIIKQESQQAGFSPARGPERSCRFRDLFRAIQGSFGGCTKDKQTRLQPKSSINKQDQGITGRKARR